MMDLDAINARAGYPPDPRPQYHTVPWYTQLLACRACPARDEARRVVAGVGPVDAEILLVGQNPGEEEDQSGVPFMGRGGVELDIWLARLGLARSKVLITNVLKCHTLNNRAPRPKEIDICTGLWMTAELTTFDKVVVVIPLGRPALFGLVGKISPLPEVLQAWWMRSPFPPPLPGQPSSPEARNLHILPLPHPAYLLRTPLARPLFYERVLPVVREHLLREVPDVLARAAVEVPV